MQSSGIGRKMPMPGVPSTINLKVMFKNKTNKEKLFPKHLANVINHTNRLHSVHSHGELFQEQCSMVMAHVDAEGIFWH